VDESGCDKRIGFRSTGWPPLSIAPIQVARFHRDRRYQILPAYTQEGVLLSRVFQGMTDTALYEDFIEQLHHHCGRWLELKSVLVMDNASFHHSDRIDQMCFDAGVKLVYLPPYAPDLNPIEEFFAELKAFITRQWHECQDVSVLQQIAAPAHSQEHHHGKSGELEIDALASKGKGLDG